jgi:acetyl esterase/lipase
MDDIIEYDWQEEGYSLKTAYYLVHASYAAYNDEQEWAGRLGLANSLRTFDCEQFHGFVGVQSKVAVVALRGTQSIGNALTDANTVLVEHPDYPGRVHGGFSDAADDVYPAVRALLQIMAGTRPILVTGHSLGGAMATLVSHRLAQDGFDVAAVYTYGSPRPSDQRFADAYNMPNYRHVHDNDLVPHLPLRWCYKHVGDLKFFTRDGQLIQENDVWESKKRELVGHAKQVQKAHRKTPEPALRLTEFDWLADHYLDGYIKAIVNLIPRIPVRRHPDYPGPAIKAVPLAALHAPATPAVPRPKFLDKRTSPSPAITERDLAEAFADQPARAPLSPGNPRTSITVQRRNIDRR